MKVLLREDISKLGKLGQIVEVADGYARNFLLPRHLAVRATKGNEALIAKIKKRRAEREAARQQAFEQQAEELRGKSITIEAKTAEERTLYGSIDARQPHAVNDATQVAGWSEVIVLYQGAGSLLPGDFTLAEPRNARGSR